MEYVPRFFTDRSVRVFEQGQKEFSASVSVIGLEQEVGRHLRDAPSFGHRSTLACPQFLLEHTMEDPTGGHFLGAFLCNILMDR